MPWCGLDTAPGTAGCQSGRVLQPVLGVRPRAQQSRLARRSRQRARSVSRARPADFDGDTRHGGGRGKLRSASRRRDDSARGRTAGGDAGSRLPLRSGRFSRGVDDKLLLRGRAGRRSGSRDRLVGGDSLHVAALLQLGVVVLAVAAVLDVVQVVARLLAQQPQRLRARHVELLLAAGPVALHARPHCGAPAVAAGPRLALLLADVAHLVEPLRRHQLQDDGLHRRHVPEAHLRDVEGAHHVRPPVVVRPLQRPVPARAQLTPHSRRPLLTLTLPAKPRSRRYSHNPVTSLVYRHSASLTITVDEWVFGPPSLI